MKLLPALGLILTLLCAGCSSYVAQIDAGKSIKPYQRWFVKSNFDDNHGIDARIMRALQERGYTVECGPLTMMPRGTQAVVSFEDHWTWDFTNHMAGLRIFVRDANRETAVASATYVGPTAVTRSVDTVIDRLVDKLLHTAEKPVRS